MIRPSERLRQFGWIGAMSGYWFVWCLPPLLDGNGDAFSDSGTLLICLSIISIATNRTGYEALSQRYQELYFLKRMRHQEVLNSLVDERLNYTFTLHQVEIDRINRRLGERGIIRFESDEDREKALRFLEDNYRDDVGEDIRKARDDLQDFLEERETEAPRWKSWAGLTLKAEWGFVILGTLQTGYGDEFVSFLTSEELELLSNRILQYMPWGSGNFPPYDSPNLL